MFSSRRSSLRFRSLWMCLLAGLCGLPGLAQNISLVPTIRTIAGNGTSGNTGDGGPATSAQLNNPLSDVIDASGNVYFTDYYNNRVQRIDAVTGVITTYAGSAAGTGGFSGDGVQATSALLNAPGGLVLDASGNLYIGDTGNNRVRKVSLSTGIITTYAGNGTGGYNGDNQQATSAELNYPDGLALDTAGNLYISERSNYRVRKVTAATGVITTVIGNGTQGYTGDGGAATSAEIGTNWSIAVDVKGNLYIADEGNQRIRKVTASTGNIATIAGTGTAGFNGDGIAATSAQINMGIGSSLDVDKLGNVYFTDEHNNRIREIVASSGLIQTIAGNGTQGYTGDGGPSTSATVNAPQRIQYNAKTSSFIMADTGNNAMRQFSTGPVQFPRTNVGSTSASQTVYLQTNAAVTINSITVPTSAGGKQEFTVGTITGCTLGASSASGTTCAVPITFTPAYPGQRTLSLTVVTSTGTYNVDLTGYALGAQATLISGTINTIAGTGTAGYAGNGSAATAAQLNAPRRIYIDPQGNLYFGDYNNNVVRKITISTGVISTVAGNGTPCGTSTNACGDGGAATAANLNAPVGVGMDTNGNLYIVDSNDNRVRVVNATTGKISTFAGTGTAGSAGDGGLATAAQLNAPSAVFLDQYNNVYIADSGNNEIREIDATTGLISTVAGSLNGCANATNACGDGGLATAATLNFPTSVTVDPNLNIYIADLNDNRIRKVTASNGIITTVAGTGTASYSGDGGVATSATLNAPRAINLDGANNIYIADTQNNVVRLVNSATGIINTIAGINAAPCTTTTATCGDGGPATSANLNGPRGVTLDVNDNLYISDTNDNRVREIGSLSAALSFATTQLGGTSTDSPKSITVLSSGTTTLTFPIPGLGMTDPSFSTSLGSNANFSISNTSTCPQLTETSSAAGSLAVGATCSYLLNFTPQAVGAISETMTITDNSSGSTTQTVTLTGTGTAVAPVQTLTSSNLTPQLGQSVTLTDTFTTIAGKTPTGTVTFYSGATNLGTGMINSSGVATLTTTQLAIGTDTVYASYPGDSNFSTGNSNNITEVVGKAASSNTLTSGNLTPNAGQSVTLTDTVSQVNGIVPTGTVTFSSNGTTLGTGTLNASGVATLSTTALTVGTDTVTASYAGDTNYGSSTSNTVTETVAKNSGSNTLTGTNATPTFGQSVAFTDTLATVNGIVPTGTVSFSSNGTVLATVSVSGTGTAMFSSTTLPIGTDNIVATYSGDSNNNASTSNTVVETVGKATNTHTLTTSNANPAYGQSVTLTDTLSSVNGVIPTGTVTFMSGTVTLGTGTLNASGVATVNTTLLPVGTDSVTATYAGNATYNASTSGPLTETVTKATNTGTLTTSNATPSYGQSVTLTDTLSAVNGTIPTGTVTFYNGTTAIGTGTVNASGVATLATAALPVGTDSVTAQYGGDTNYNTNTSNAVSETVAKATGTNVLTTSNATPTFGQSVTLTDTLSLANGVAPTGTVTFYNGTTAIGTGTVNASGVATLATTALPVGTDSVTATYGGDGNFNTTTSAAVTETVAKGSAGGTLTTTNASPAYGTSITLTDTLTSINGVVPTGTVTFYNGTTAIGTGTVNASGVATLTTGTLPIGTDSITASYGGDSNYVASTTTALTETVSKVTGTGTLTTSNASPAFGSSVTLTDTLSSVNGTVPTGTVTFYNGTIALGTGTVNASGVATLATSALPVGTDSVTAQYGGDATYNGNTSNAVSETVAKATGTNTLTTSNATPNYGQSVTLTATLTSVNGVVPTGTVTFYNGTTSLGTGTVNASGVATLATSALPVGTDSVTAVYGGDGNYATTTSAAVTETVGKAAGSSTLTSSNQSPSYGQSVTLTDTLTTVNGVAPTGTVTFYNGTTSLGTGTVDASGVATLATAALPVGTDSVTAVYGGDGNYATTTSNAVTETVAKAAAVGTLTTSNASPTAGQSVTLTDTLPSVNGVVPTGTVTFYNGGTAIGTGTLNASGVATLTTGSLPVGTDSITAVYGGDTKYAGSTSNAVAETVTKNAGSNTLTTSNATPAYGQSVTLTATLAGANGLTPTGTVTFYNGTTSLGTGTLNASGLATLATSALPVGTDSVTAQYGGDGNFAASTSNAVTETVGKSQGTTTLTTSNATPSYGQSVTLTDTVAVVNGVTPTGTVTFYNGTTAIGTGTFNASGVATLATSALPVGTDSITAGYAGDSNYAASTSNAVTETVAKSSAAATLTSSNTAPSAGQSVTLTDTLPVVNGVAPTGTVTFYNGTTAIGTGTFNASGVATLTTGSLPVGSDSITASYAGDGNYAANTSNAVTETVSKDASTGTLTTSNTAPTYGQSVTLTDTLPAVNGLTPTGTVTFYSGTTPLGTGTLTGGVAILATSSLPVGTDSVTAVYGGDNNFSTTTSNAVTENVSKSGAAGVLTTSNATPNYGQSVTLTDTLPTVNGVTPTGTVTFYNGTTSLGTGTVNGSGVATLSTAALPVGTDSVTAVYGGDSNYSTNTSNAVSETVAKNTGTGTLSTSNATPTYGQSVTLTDTLPTVNGVTPTGTVTFYNGTTSIGTGTVNGSGVATLTTGSLPVGSDSITATYGGDSNYGSTTSNSVIETVSKTAAAGTLTTSNASPAYGQSVTLTDTLPTVNGVAPTGSVTFYNGTTVLGTGTVTAGVATLTTGSLPVGTDSITAVYGGDSNYNGSTAGPLTETVGKVTGTNTLTSSNTAPNTGQAVTLTDTLSTVNGVAPTGTVTFYNGTTSLGTGTVNSSGVAMLTTTTLPLGTDTVTATYGGDGNYASSNSNAVTETVTKNTGSGSLTTSNPSPSFGQSVTLTNTLPTVNGIVPTGTVTFYNGTTSLGTGAVNGSGAATLTTAALPVGTDSVTAVYGGDGNYSAVTSNAVTETVTKNTGTGTLTSSNTAPSVGQSVTLTDTLPSVNGVQPTGTVTFYNGATSLGTGTVNASGVATLATTALPVGTDSVTAVYGGDGNYASTTSNAVTETVAKNGAAGALVASSTSPSFGQTVTLTDTLPTTNGVVPTGTVTFYNGTTALGTGTVNASGVATFSTASLPVGTDTLTAVYGGDSNNSGNTSNAVAVTVAKTAATSTLTTSNASPVYGTSVTFTETLTGVNGVVPTGTVTFYNGTTALGTVTANNAGVAMLSTSTLPVGTDSITAQYGGDANYSSNTSNVVTETVTKGSAAGTLTTSNASPTAGQSITLTDTLPTIAGVVPTGTVTFYNGGTAIGTGTVNGSGVATLTTGSLPTGTDTITAVYGGDTNYSTGTSNAVTETVGKATGTATLAASTTTPNDGQAVTLTATLSTVNGIAPTGSVTFSNGTTVLGTGTVNGSGVATLSTSSLPVGTDSVTAVYGGDTNYNTETTNAVSITVAKGSNNGTLTTSNATPNYGQSVTLTDTLATVNGVAPTGTVTFYNGTTSLGTGTVNASGVATLATSALPVGTDSVTAVYGGDGNYSTGTSNAVTENVGKITGTGTLTTSSTAPTAGQSVTLTDTLSTTNGVVPTGTVTFYSGTTALGIGTVNASGVATLATTALPVGTDSVTAVYGGDASNNTNTSNAVTVTVAKNAGAGTLTASNTTPTSGQSITLTDTLPVTNGVAPTGTVTFYNGTTAIGTGTVNASGVATLTTGSLPVGADSITAVYGGDGNYGSNTAGPLTVTVGKSTGTDTLTTSNATPNVGQSVTLTDTLTTVNGIAPTGTVTFYSGTTSLGTGTVTSGVVTLATTALPVGTDSVTAVYGGDGNYATSISNAVTETVAKGAGTDVLTASSTTPSYGQSITLTDTIPVVNGIAPTGTVTFYNGTTAIGTGTVNASGVATLATGSLPVGADSLTAVYGGDGNYSSGITAPLTVTVGKSTDAATLATSNASPTYGQAVTLTATLPAVNGTYPTGTITFLNGTDTLGTGVLNGSGVATLTTSTLPVGTDSVTASYPGDGNFSAATSNVVTETVGKSAGSSTLTSSNATPNAGQPVTFTDTLPVSGSTVPTGTVTFYNGTNVLGTGTVNSSGVATLATGALPAGVDNVTAVYGGDSNYSGSTSNAVSETVAKNIEPGTLTASTTTPTAGQSVTLTVTQPTVYGVVPTGTVNFYSNGALIGTGTLNGTGVATLATTSLPSGSDAITAIYSGDGNYTSTSPTPLTITVGKATGTNVLTTSNAAPVAGQQVALTDTLSTVNGVVPTGTVTFSNGGTILGTGTVNASGVATITTTSLPVGTDTVTASYAGDSNYAASVSNPVTETVSKATAGGLLTSSNTAPTYGQSITLTDTLPVSNGVAPTGTVTFFNGPTTIGTGTVNSSGVATLTTGSLPAGTDSLTAVYGGDGNYSEATSNTLVETVGKTNTTSVLTTSNSAPVYGQMVTLTDALSSVNGTVPTGTVTFLNGTTVIGTGTVNSTGIATLATAALPVGTDNVTAVYGGDGNYNTSTSNPETETVTKATNTGTLTTSNATPSFGQSVTFTDTLPIVNTVVPTGTVTFNDGTTVLGTGTVNSSGIATLTAGSLPVGTSSVTASYSGDTNFSAAVSNAVAETVSKSTGTGVLTSTTTTPTAGQPVTFTDTLPVVNGVAPTGTVTFYNGTTAIGTGTVNSSGVATLTTGSLPVGTDSITAVYGGDTNYASNTSNVLTATVSKGAAMGVLTTSNATPNAGQSVTLTDTLPTANGVVPTGTVTFYNGATAIGTGTVNGSGVATLATSTLPVGTDTITAVYGGDGNYSSGTSNAVTETVAKGASTGVLTTSNASPNVGQSVTLTDTLPTVNGAVPTGTVTFYNGTTALGTGTVNGSGVATLATSALPVGTDTVTAVYGGDSNYSSGTSNAITEVVGKGASAGVLTSSNAAPTAGQPVTLTDTLPTVNGVVPTGTVTFYNGATAIGTGTVNSSGVATLTTGSLPVGSDNLTAVYGGDSNYSSAPSNAITVNVAKGTSAGVLTTSNASPTTGQSVTLTDTLPTANGVVPTGTVTFYSGTTVLGTGTVNASGVATLATSALPVGTDTVTAVYGGDSNYGSGTSNAVTETVAKGSSAGVLTTSNASPTTGQSVMLTDTLPTINGVVPTGTVTFYNGTTAIGTGTVNASGVATFTTGSLPVGTNSITAVYGGDASYSGGTSNAISVTVAKGTATGVLATSNASPTTGQSVTLTDSLPTVNGVVPTGTVTFYNGTTAIGTGTVNASGVATLTTGSLPVGTNSITAVYGGDPNYSNGASNAISVTVTKGTATGVLSTSNATPNVGQSVTLTDTLPTVNGVVPTGTVTFYNGTTPLGTGTINGSGVATLATSALPAGTDTVTAVYGGDSNYSNGTSNAVTETVAQNTTTVVLAASATSTTPGQAVTLTATVAGAAGQVPTGSVTFTSGTTVLGTGTVNAAGVATVTTSTLPVGTDPVKAVYGGDTNNQAGTSNIVSVVVAAPVPTITLVSSPNPQVAGQPVTLTVTLAGATGQTFSGTVSFYDGTTLLGTAAVSNGVATLTTSSLTTAVHKLTGVYTSTDQQVTVTSGAVSQSVIDFTIGSSTPTLTASYSSTAAYTINLTPVTGIAFGNPIALSVTGLPSNYTVTFSPTTVTPGTGAASTQMVVQTGVNPLTTAKVEGQNHGTALASMALGFLLTPFLAIGRVRRRLPKVAVVILVSLITFGLTAPVMGCGGGYFGSTPNTYTLTVTGTSGTLHHSTTVTLTVH